MVIKSHILRPIPSGAPRGWQVLVDGALVETSHVEISNPRFGVLTYGQSPLGYDTWSFRELAGGGVVLVPHARHPTGLLVGLVHQNRPNQGGWVWNLPRGFVDPGEAHDGAAAREFSEETGIDATAVRIFPLGDLPANPNSAFFETVEPGEGVRFFGVEIPVPWLREGDGGWGLDPSRRGAIDQLSEPIGAACFVRWQEAAGLSDLFTVAGVARLLAALA